LISNLVFVEAMMLLKRRMGSAAAAIHVGSELRENPLFVWISHTPELEKVSTVFAFDNHFSQMPAFAVFPDLSEST
jgi:hypothetical protein